MGAVKNFDEDHAAEQRIAAWAGWVDVYRTLFPALTTCMRETRLDQQLRGIDRRIGWADYEITIDEKYDSHTTHNFFLETVSVEETGALGWVVKDLACDYIGYLFQPERAFYLIPRKALQRAWTLYGDVWKRDFAERRIANQGYVTLGVPVPRHIVLDAIDGCQVARHAEHIWVRTRE